MDERKLCPMSSGLYLSDYVLNNHGNSRFVFDRSEYYVTSFVKSILSQETGFIDVIFDEKDLDTITKEVINLHGVEKQKMISEKLLNLFLKKIYFDQTGIKSWDNLVEPVRTILNPRWGGVRLHLFLDNVSDEDLQMVLNDLMRVKDLYVMTYSTVQILTNQTTNGDMLVNSKDYRVISSKAYHDQILAKIEKRIKDDKHKGR